MPDVVGRLRPPRLAGAPASPAVGELYYNTGNNTLYYWNGTAWAGAGAGASGPAGGDLTGTYPNPTLNAPIAWGAVTGTTGAITSAGKMGNAPAVSCNRPSAGVYNFTWSPTFATTPPVFFMTPYGNEYFFTVTSCTLTSAQVVCANTQSGAGADQNFSFLVLGGH
jgi:hypothetical protein